MSVALTCDLVMKIGKSRKQFRDQCHAMLEELLELGAIYCDKIEDEEYYDRLISETDFNGRSVLNIICYCKFN